MPETRRFLRYVIPSLLSLLEAFLLAYLAWPDQTPKILCVINNFNAGGAFAAFLLTGAFGYFLSVVHHTMSWLCIFKGILVVDYRPFFSKAFEDALVTKEELNAWNAKKEAGLTIDQASQAMAALWNESRECSEQVKGANDRVDSLTDLMHGAGAAAVGTVLAYLAYGVLASAAFIKSEDHWLRPTVVFALLFYIHLKNYFKLQEHTKRVVEIVFWQELERRKEAPPKLLLLPNEPWKSKLMFWRKP